MLEDLQPPVRKTTCKVATVAAGLSENDARILFDAVADTENWKGHDLVSLQDLEEYVNEQSN